EIEIINNLAGSQHQVLANVVLLQIVFDNIISNGFKFSDNKKVTCALERNAENLVVKISDQGKGISASEREEVFKPFYTRSKELGKTGEGMGLYMAQKIINLFKGKIEISSSSTQKSTFIITLPLF
ncbi:MAG: ATP-binding protein, partial [Pedobacter sp.]